MRVPVQICSSPCAASNFARLRRLDFEGESNDRCSSHLTSGTDPERTPEAGLS